jgi:hypothetical protein
VRTASSAESRPGSRLLTMLSAFVPPRSAVADVTSDTMLAIWSATSVFDWRLLAPDALIVRSWPCALVNATMISLTKGEAAADVGCEEFETFSVADGQLCTRKCGERGHVLIEAIGPWTLVCSVVRALMICASVVWARSTGLAATRPKRATKKMTERDANLANCIVVEMEV